MIERPIGVRHIVFLYFMAIMFISTLSCSIQHDQEVTINNGVSIVQDFFVDSSTTGLHTAANGTIFYFGNGQTKPHIKIVSLITIDPIDWGGIAFYIPKSWGVSNITSSFLANTLQDNSMESTVIWQEAGADSEYDKMIEIGTNRYTPTGGGTGFVIIELDYIGKENEIPSIFKVIIGVGSAEIGGVKTMHPDFKVIEVSL